MHPSTINWLWHIEQKYALPPLISQTTTATSPPAQNAISFPTDILSNVQAIKILLSIKPKIGWYLA